jgi:uncharacterized alpha-E superfamily protein
VAEHCFWMTRYLERSENTARILDVNQTLLLDFEVPVEKQWRPLLEICGIHDFAGVLDAETVQHFMTWDRDNPASIACSIALARENARIIREVISGEMWERLNYYHLWMCNGGGQSLFDWNRSEFYNQIKRINQLFNGIADATMLHGEPWEFCQLGRSLERACQTARILDVKYHILLPALDQVGTPIDNAHWVAILMSCSGYEPYHKKPRIASDPGVAIAGFLIFDPLFPRSIRRCLLECQKAAQAISGRPTHMAGNDVESAIAEILAWLNHRTISEIMQTGLHEMLISVVNRIHDLGAAIQRTYFEVQNQLPPAPPAADDGRTAMFCRVEG